MQFILDLGSQMQKDILVKQVVQLIVFEAII
jgi:hypothetical protein